MNQGAKESMELVGYLDRKTTINIATARTHVLARHLCAGAAPGPASRARAVRDALAPGMNGARHDGGSVWLRRLESIC
jgi:hypothetical protein